MAMFPVAANNTIRILVGPALRSPHLYVVRTNVRRNSRMAANPRRRHPFHSVEFAMDGTLLNAEDNNECQDCQDEND
jgi:hypothetical protein